MSTPSELVPMELEWTRAGRHGNATAWRCGPITVLSELANAKLPDGSGQSGLQWLVSVSFNGKRPKDNHVRKALRAFSMVGAEEDNHHPGIARHFWRVCDPSKRVSCECKETELIQVEPDGYRWTTPKDVESEGCRGCDYQDLSGKPCPIHSKADQPAREAPPA